MILPRPEGPPMSSPTSAPDTRDPRAAAPTEDVERSLMLRLSGAAVLLMSVLVLIVWPEHLSGVFDAMFESVRPIVVDVFLTGTVGIAIIVSVIAGRLLERLGFTDALVSLLAPLMRRMRVNPTVIIPASYNILGDINAAGRIGGPVLRSAGATRHEQMIAVATMVQSQQSLATFVIGLIALSAAGVVVFPVVLATVFLPMVLVPLLLSRTVFRDTRQVDRATLPRFTPRGSLLHTTFGAAREGAEVLFLIVIPAVVVVFALIGALDYAGVWVHVAAVFDPLFSALLIEPTTGTTSVLAAPTLAMAQLAEVATTVDPRLVVGSFVIASSGFPLSTVLGQIPAVWAESSDLTERDALVASLLGIAMRLLSAFLIAATLTFTV